MTISLPRRRELDSKHENGLTAAAIGGGLRSRDPAGREQRSPLPLAAGEGGSTTASGSKLKVVAAGGAGSQRMQETPSLEAKSAETRDRAQAGSHAVSVPRSAPELRFDPSRSRGDQVGHPTVRSEHPFGNLLGATLDTFAMPVAVLDAFGRIALVNVAWRTFLHRARRSLPADGIGAGYLDLEALGVLRRRDALTLRIGLRRMLYGVATSLECTVCVPQPDADRWYQVRAVRLEIEGSTRIVVTHEDVTSLHTARKTVEELSQRLLTIQEDERQRIAAELHDSTAQQLTAAALYLGSLRRKLQQDAETNQTIDQIQQTIIEAQKEIHTLSYLLNPPYLDRDGLRATLARFIDGYARRTGLAAVADISGDIDRFNPEVQLALLRIIQEALSNVHRHAAARSVRVRMKTTRTFLLFCVADDGKGRRHSRRRGDVAPESPLNLGIRGMQTRIHQFGGALKILSGTCGTSVCGKVPLERCRA